MIQKSNQFINDRELKIKKGVRLTPEDAERLGDLSRALGLNDRRGADGFAEFARLALAYTADRIEAIRRGHPKGWRDLALREIGVDPDDVFDEE